MEEHNPTHLAIHSLNLSIVCTSVVMFLFSQISRSSSQILILPILLLCGVVIGHTRVGSTQRSATTSLVALLAFIALVGAALRENPHPVYPGLWSGFGPLATATATTAALIAAVAPVGWSSAIASSKTRVRIAKTVMFAVLAPRLLLFVQPPNGLINLGDTTYHVLDEMLAPISGGLPYGNYTPQYTGILGWVLLPLQLLNLDGRTFMFVVIGVCGVLNLAVPILVVAITRLILPNADRSLLFCAFVAVWTVCGSDLGYSSQVREFSHFARLVPSLLALWLLLRSIKGFINKKSAQLGYLGGVGLSIAVLNSFDHGLTFAVAVVATLSIVCYFDSQMRSYASRFVIGVSVVLIVYVIGLQIAGQSFSLKSYVGLRFDALSGGVYSEQKITSGIGPHLLTLAISVTLVALIQSPQKMRTLMPKNPVMNILCLTLALWSPMLLVKFILKDPRSGVEVPSYFALTFISVATVIARLDISDVRSWGFRRSKKALPLLFICGLALGSVFPATNVNSQDELKRISGRFLNRNDWSSTPGRSSEGWTPTALASEDNFLIEVSRLAEQFKEQGLSLGYFGIFGNTVELNTGIDNLTGIPAPESLRFEGSQYELACRPVSESRPDLVITYDTALPCLGYSEDTNLLNPVLQLYRRDD